LSPWGDISTTLAPAPSTLFEPSKYIVHTLDRSSGPMFCNSSHSAVKSGRIWDLIAFLFSYVMSRGEVQFPTRIHALLPRDYSEYWTKVPCWLLWLGERKSSFVVFTLSLTCYMQVSLYCLWSCMLSVVSSYLGRVVASDSKRGYLCSIVVSCLYLIWGSDRNL
jgi:hypothetical protein